MRTLVFDPFAGISGDMILGALVDLGLPEAWLADFVGGLGLSGVAVRVERAERSGIDCARVRFELPHEHAHRHLADVLEVVDRAEAVESVKQRAGAVFRRLAEAEAEIHGIDVERVHFHEVGALDAILDVLCACAGFEELGFESFRTRPVALGTGWVEIEHGRFPVPAPATLKLLQGIPVAETSLPGECTTPTGAAILATVLDRGPFPDRFVVHGSGYGAGTRDPEGYPNCLRLIDAELESSAGMLYMVQADVDDLQPEFAPAARDALMDAGAVDAVTSPVGMKKGRPGLRFEALVEEARLDAVVETLFRSTSTIGARCWPVRRLELERREERVEWRGRSLRRKRVRLPGGGERTKVEYDDVVRVARELGLAPYEVRTALDGDLAVPASEE